MSRPIRAILFDFDGTLADSYAAITASVNHVRAVHRLEPLPESRVRAIVGHGLLQLMNDVVPGGDPEQNATIYREHHPQVMYSHTRLLEGVHETLHHLRAKGIKMAVCSNKPAQITRDLVAALELDTLFDATFGPEDAGKPKPDPAMVQLAMRTLGATADETLFVGDMPIDIETARNAGVPVWVLPTGSSDREALEAANPDQIFTRMTEMIGALENLGGK
jgi:phosphoglycolate phosphatase